MTPGTLDKPLARLLSDIIRAQAQAPPPGMDDGVVAEVQQARAAGVAAAAAAVDPSTGQQAGQSAGDSGAAAQPEGGEQVLKSKLQDYVMLDGKEGQTAPMSLDQLKQQVGGRPGRLHDALLQSASPAHAIKLTALIVCGGAQPCMLSPGARKAPNPRFILPILPDNGWLFILPPRPQIQDKMRAKKAQAAAAEKEARRTASADETDRLWQALRGGKKQQGSKQKKGGGSKGFGA